MKKTIEKSEEQAILIKLIAMPVQSLDVEYCRGIVKDMVDQAGRQEAMAVLNPSYPQLKNTILRTKAEALSLLCAYVDCLKEITEMEKQLADENKVHDDISKMFM